MTEEQKQKLERQIWNIANELRGKMDADTEEENNFIFLRTLICQPRQSENMSRGQWHLSSRQTNRLWHE